MLNCKLWADRNTGEYLALGFGPVHLLPQRFPSLEGRSILQQALQTQSGGLALLCCCSGNC